MIKLYKGSELADFNEKFNVTFSIGNIRDLSFGSNNKTYNLNLPLTKTNKRLLKFISQPDVKSEPSETWRLYIGEQLVIQGSILITKHNTLFAEIIINSDDWTDPLKNLKMTDLDLSVYDHALTHDIVGNSWLDPYVFYRYPMIDFGALVSGEYGPTAKWYLNDFIPMFSISQLIAKILAPYTIVSSWLATAFIKDLYILAKEITAPDGFITNKSLEANVTALSDNEEYYDVLPGATNAVYIYAMIYFGTIVKDEGNDFALDKYIVPETGTYRFMATIVGNNDAIGNSYLTILDETLSVSLVYTRGAVETVIHNITAPAYIITELIENITYTLESGYIHLLAGDEVAVRVSALVNAQNIGGTTQRMTISVKTSTKIENVWTNVNKHAGINKNISAEEMLPDMSQADFLTAIRNIFNLRFWMDKSRRVLYIEPWDQFLSSTVVDLTEFIDFESIDTELISPNYNKTIRLKWKDDSSDAAFTEYLKSAVSPGMKDITMTSLFTKSGTEIKEHPFSSIITGYNRTISQFAVNTPRIWQEVIDIVPIIFNRKTGFNTRIVEWKGLTAGFTWYFDSETKTTYPKIQGLDWATIYSTYWQKLLHYIDKGKLLTVRMKIKPMFLTQFFTVINTATSEGFRPTYQINDDYYFLQQIISDGISAELELILKV